MEITWIKSVDCRECVREIQGTSKKKLKQIVEQRKKCVKCKGCERLKEYIDSQIQA